MKLRSKPMTKEQIKQYLHKLQLENFTPRADLATLQKLHAAHLKYIPYDNFDCLNSKITSLKREDMFNKLILHNRGGICFELNGLYAWLLESLGFNFVMKSLSFFFCFTVFQSTLISFLFHSCSFIFHIGFRVFLANSIFFRSG